MSQVRERTRFQSRDFFLIPVPHSTFLAGTTVKVDGDELLVLREEDIMAVVNA